VVRATVTTTATRIFTTTAAAGFLTSLPIRIQGWAD
jgi:hypothetical protein